jgi:hypothetical protein
VAAAFLATTSRLADSVAAIPARVPHSLECELGQESEFVIFGTPPMAIDDERARPVKPVG